MQHRKKLLSSKLQNFHYHCCLCLLIAIVELLHPEGGISVQAGSEIWLLVPCVELVCLSWLLWIVAVSFAGSWCGTGVVREDLGELVLCYYLQKFWVGDLRHLGGKRVYRSVLSKATNHPQRKLTHFAASDLDLWQLTSRTWLYQMNWSNCRWTRCPKSGRNPPPRSANRAISVTPQMMS